MKAHKIVFEKKNVFVAVTLEYWKQKRALKKRFQLPGDWFGTSIWPSCHGQGSQICFSKKRRTCVIVQTTGFNRPAKFLILLKHWGYGNFELNWFHGLSKSSAIPFSQVSAKSFRFDIQECSRSLYAFIAFRPTCFARRLVMWNLHETPTQRAR